MKRELIYWGHRFRDSDHHTQSLNLAKAVARFTEFDRECIAVGAVAYAPWLELARAEVREDFAMPIIEHAIDASDRVVLDLDGRDDWSAGLTTEKNLAENLGKPVEIRK